MPFGCPDRDLLTIGARVGRHTVYWNGSLRSALFPVNSISPAASKHCGRGWAGLLGLHPDGAIYADGFAVYYRVAVDECCCICIFLRTTQSWWERNLLT